MEHSIDLQSEYFDTSRKFFGQKNSLKIALGILLAGIASCIVGGPILIIGLVLIGVAFFWLLIGTRDLNDIQKKMTRLEKFAVEKEVELRAYDPDLDPTSQALKATRRHTGNLLAGLAAVFLIVGAILPWGSLLSIFGSASKSGMSGDGPFFFAAGVGIGFVAIFHLGKQRRIYSWPLIPLGLLLFVIMAVDYGSLMDVSAQTTEYVTVLVGPGPYVVFLGAVLTFVAGILRVPGEGNAKD